MADMRGPKIIMVLDNQPVGELRLTAPRISIGRRSTCDIVIEHPNISGTHASIFLEHNSYVIEDLKSTNGTLVNGVTIMRHVLEHLDVIELGLHKLYYFDHASSMEARAAIEKTANFVPRKLPPLLGGDVAAMKEDALDATQGIMRDDFLAIVESKAEARYMLHYIAGRHVGKTIDLDNESVTVGEPGLQSAVISKRATGYFLTPLYGKALLTVNGRNVGPGAHPLAEYDFIDIAGSVIEFVKKRA
jgi:hypothetical protein